MRDTEWRERVHNRIDDRGRRCNCASLARALDAQRIGRRRRNSPRSLEGWQACRLRHRIVEHAAGYELPVLVVHALFPERLSDALCDAAMNHAFHNHRVDYIAHIVNCNVPQYGGVAGIGVNLDYADVCAERPSEVLRVVDASGF